MPQTETLSELACRYEMPTVLAQEKNHDHIDAHAPTFIARSRDRRPRIARVQRNDGIGQSERANDGGQARIASRALDDLRRDAEGGSPNKTW